LRPAAATIILLTAAALAVIGWNVVPRARAPLFAWSMQHTVFYGFSTPAVRSIEPGGPIEVGLVFQPTVPGTVVGMRFYRVERASSQHSEGHLWATDGRLLATVRFAAGGGDGWQEAWFPSPVHVPADTRLVVSRFSPTADTVLSSPFRERAGSPARINLPRFRDLAAEGHAINVFHPNAPGFPSIDAGPLSFWVDVLFVPDGRR
jgi:hypothetical protein